jgi:hypothetical protein
VQEIALSVIDTQVAHLGQHLRTVDELGDGLDADDGGNIHKTTHGGLVETVLYDALDELSVDLEEIDGKGFQVPE